MTNTEPLWTYWPLGENRSSLELHDSVTGGIGIELEVLDGGGEARTYALWRLSDTGAVLAWVAAGQA